MADDAVTQAGPTCPLSDDGLFDAITESGMFPSHRRREQGKALALAVVAAERARLREVFVRIGSEGDFDEACQTVDANQRRA